MPRSSEYARCNFYAAEPNRTKGVLVMDFRQIAAAILVMAMAGCGTSEKAIISSAQANVAKSLKDPGSAQFTEVTHFPHGKGSGAVCGMVNAKNAFGGYVGATPFYSVYKYTSSDDVVFQSAVRSIGSDEPFDSSSKYICVAGPLNPPTKSGDRSAVAPSSKASGTGTCEELVELSGLAMTARQSGLTSEIALESLVESNDVAFAAKKKIVDSAFLVDRVDEKAEKGRLTLEFEEATRRSCLQPSDRLKKG